LIFLKAAPPNLMICREVMTELMDEEESFGEVGYYLASFEVR